jgi:hypothetical protein
MKRSSLVAIIVFSLSCLTQSAFAQSTEAENATRPRVVKQQPLPQVESPNVAPKVATEPVPVGEPEVVAHDSKATNRDNRLPSLTPHFIQSRITEAERLLKTQPKKTALTTSPSIQFVTLAALERSTGRVHLANISKEFFLKKGSEVTVPSSLGSLLTVRVIRANGVNTAVTVFDSAGQSLAPLVVEFPIERNGLFREMAYYTSAHPALLTPELVRSGRSYIRSMLDVAAKRLRERGTNISPQLVDIAERLCLVEHVDHSRFKNENRAALYDEIFSLYALNDLDTYRYSVSSAGAGGMVQMIPWAYNLVRQRHPGAALIPDFVVGMRTHSNALQAMLLYMHDTWNDLAANSEVQYAMNSKLATQEELMAAGYNSNAAKLPGYLRRGGSGWRSLIPRETQMYLQIYKSVDSLVPMKPRTASPLAKVDQN